MVRLGAADVQMSRPSKFPALATIKLDEPVPPHALQVESTPPASAVIARLGDLQRIVLLQLALSGATKPDAESSTADKKGVEQADVLCNLHPLAADLCQAARAAATFDASCVDVPFTCLDKSDLRTKNITLAARPSGFFGVHACVSGTREFCACAGAKGEAEAERDTAEMPDAAVLDLPEGSPPHGLMQDMMGDVVAAVAEVAAEVGGAARRYCRLLKAACLYCLLQNKASKCMKQLGKVREGCFTLPLHVSEMP